MLKRKYMRHIPINSDVRTQIGLVSNDGSATLERCKPLYYQRCVVLSDTMDLMANSINWTLLLVTESAPVNKAGTGKVLEVPIGIEAVKQFRKALMFLHSFQCERRSIECGSPKYNTER